MIFHQRFIKLRNIWIVAIFVFYFLLSSCSIFNQPVGNEAPAFQETSENYPQSEVIFQVRIPSPLMGNEVLLLEIIDDVTGVYFNPSHYEMTAQDELNYIVRLPLTIGQKIKYRFARKSSDQTIYETTSQNEIVRARVMLVEGPLLIQDLVAAWTDQTFSGSVGRIRGQLIDSANNSPLPNVAVYAAGMQTISASDGTFVLEELPVWTHNVVIASLDGKYKTFQQGAFIAEHATTPIEIGMQKRSTVSVTFEVKVPENFETSLPLRLASNFYPLGFPEADLPSGSSMISANLPQLTKTSDNTYSQTFTLPAGADLRYKFTFGDGFWNSELTNTGSFVVRELIVPMSDTTIRKQINLLESPGMQEININLITPATTPLNDFISLQLNPFGWMQPLPMQQMGQNQWSYSLFTPLHLLGDIGYRFCRNDQCDKAISNPSQNGMLKGQTQVQAINIDLTTWQTLESSALPTMVEVNGITLQPRPDFIAGFELSPDFSLSWKSSIDSGLNSIASTAANWVILSPTWSITNIDPPQLEPVAGNDLLWPDLLEMGVRITATGMQPVIFPRVSDRESSEQLWTFGSTDAGWWQTLFDRYRHLVLQSADLAEILNAGGLIVGDPAMKPLMDDVSSSHLPINSDEQWKQLIQTVRTRYTGPVIGVISVPETSGALPSWIHDVDAIYVLFTPSIEGVDDRSVDALNTAFSNALDVYLQPIAEQLNKPVLIGINPPASLYVLSGCLAKNDSCLNNVELSGEEEPLDLDLQARIYNAAIIESASRPWIKGFISREFDPLVVVKDQHPSVNGKPAWDVLWFWYHLILNKPS